MIPRSAFGRIEEALARQAAVALIGPRQVGKTTLAHAIGAERNALYLDLESRENRDKLTEPALFLRAYEDRLVILDEIRRVPELFQTLRGLIDQGRRRGKRHGRFLVLGSAAIDLLRQSGESLAGRIAYVEMGPLDVLEAGQNEASCAALWLRGGFPDSFLARSDAPARTLATFYRTAAGVDLVLDLPRGERWAVEIKLRLAARPEKGFHLACEDLEPARQFVVYAGDRRFPVSAAIEGIGVHEMAKTLARAG